MVKIKVQPDNPPVDVVNNKINSSPNKFIRRVNTLSGDLGVSIDFLKAVQKYVQKGIPFDENYIPEENVPEIEQDSETNNQPKVTVEKQKKGFLPSKLFKNKTTPEEILFQQEQNEPENISIASKNTSEVVEEFIKPLVLSQDMSLVDYLSSGINDQIIHPFLKIKCNAEYINTANIYIIHTNEYAFDSLIEALEHFIAHENELQLADEHGESGKHPDYDHIRAAEAPKTPNLYTNNHNNNNNNHTNSSNNSSNIPPSDSSDHEEVHSITFNRNNKNKSVMDKNKKSTNHREKSGKPEKELIKYYFWIDFCCVNQFAGDYDGNDSDQTELYNNINSYNDKYIDKNNKNSGKKKEKTNILSPPDHMNLMVKIGHTVCLCLPPFANNTATPVPFTRTWCLYELLLTALTATQFSIFLGHYHNEFMHYLTTHNMDAINRILDTNAIEIECSLCYSNNDKNIIHNNIFDLVQSGYVESNQLITALLQKYISNTAISIIKRSLQHTKIQLETITSALYSTALVATSNSNSNNSSSNNTSGGDGSSIAQSKAKSPRTPLKSNKIQPAATTTNNNDNIISSNNSKNSDNNAAKMPTKPHKYTPFELLLLAFGCYTPPVINTRKQNPSKLLTKSDEEIISIIGGASLLSRSADQNLVQNSDENVTNVDHKYDDISSVLSNTIANNAPITHITEQQTYIAYFEMSLNLTTFLLTNKHYSEAEVVFNHLLHYNTENAQLNSNNNTSSKSNKHNNSSNNKNKNKTHRYCLPISHPIILSIQGNLALLYKIQHNYTAAIEKYLNIIVTKQALLGSVHPSAVMTQYNLACCYRDYCAFLQSNGVISHDNNSNNNSGTNNNSSQSDTIDNNQTANRDLSGINTRNNNNSGNSSVKFDLFSDPVLNIHNASNSATAAVFYDHNVDHTTDNNNNYNDKNILINDDAVTSFKLTDDDYSTKQSKNSTTNDHTDRDLSGSSTGVSKLSNTVSSVSKSTKFGMEIFEEIEDEEDSVKALPTNKAVLSNDMQMADLDDDDKAFSDDGNNNDNNNNSNSNTGGGNNNSSGGGTKNNSSRDGGQNNKGNNVSGGNGIGYATGVTYNIKNNNNNTNNNSSNSNIHGVTINTDTNNNSSSSNNKNNNKAAPAAIINKQLPKGNKITSFRDDFLTNYNPENFTLVDKVPDFYNQEKVALIQSNISQAIKLYSDIVSDFEACYGLPTENKTDNNDTNNIDNSGGNNNNGNNNNGNSSSGSSAHNTNNKPQSSTIQINNNNNSNSNTNDYNLKEMNDDNDDDFDRELSGLNSTTNNHTTTSTKQNATILVKANRELSGEEAFDREIAGNMSSEIISHPANQAGKHKSSNNLLNKNNNNSNINNNNKTNSNNNKLSKGRTRIPDPVLIIAEQNTKETATENITQIYIESLNHLCNIYLEQNNTAQAKPLLHKLLTIKIQHYGEYHIKTLDTYETLGILYSHEPAAKNNSANSNSNGSSSGGSNNNNNNNNSQNKAANYLTKAVQIREMLYGSSHYTTITTMHKLAKLCKKMGSYEKSLLLYLKVIAYHESKLDPNNNISVNINSISNTNNKFYSLTNYLKTHTNNTNSNSNNNSNNASDSTDYSQPVIRTTDKMEPILMEIYEPISELFILTTQYKAAEQLLLVLLQNKEEMHGANTPTTLATALNIADIYTKQGKFILAENYHMKVLNGRITTVGSTHIDTFVSMYHLASCLVQAKQYQNSVTYFEKCLEGFDVHYSTLGYELYEPRMYNSNSSSICKNDKKSGNDLPVPVEYSNLTVESLANVYKVLQNYNKAKILYDRLKVYYKLRLGANHERTVYYTKLLAELHYK